MQCAAAEFAIPVKLQFRDGVGERLEAQIARVNTGFVLLRSTVALDSSRKLELDYLERRIPCETVYCHCQPDGTYRVGARMLEGTNGALRVERRIKIDAAGMLNTPALPVPTPVRLIDMSSSGVGVKLHAPIRVGDLAYLELEHGVAFGEIRHCAKMETGHRAGLFVEEFIARTPCRIDPWSAQGVEAPGRSGTSRVMDAIRTALFSKGK